MRGSREGMKLSVNCCSKLILQECCRRIVQGMDLDENPRPSTSRQHK